MEQNIYFQSDQHFSHENIIKYCQRPFASIEEMNQKIIENYINTITDNDIVFFLGDITIKRSSSFKPFLSDVLRKLPGEKHLILGNHDKYSNKFYIEDCGFISVNRKINTAHVIMTHDPKTFTKGELDSDKLLIHGHIHLLNQNSYSDSYPDNLKKYNLFDVGCDANNFTPVSLDYIKKSIIRKNKSIKSIT